MSKFKTFLKSNYLYLAATFLLLLMFTLAIFSIKDDTITNDEVVHIPAGYTYLSLDSRMNPEHPPLQKILSGIFLLPLSPKVPYGSPSWQNADQWEFGRLFLFQSSNDADKLIFWARFPTILLMIILGIFLFRFSRELFGEKVALISLFIYSFSPNIIAHGRLVTTDLAATLGTFLSLYCLWRFLENQTRKNLILAGITLGLALLLKFSTVLLLPLEIILYGVWLIKEKKLIKNFWRSSLNLFLIFIIGLAMVWFVYGIFTLREPSSLIHSFIGREINYGMLAIPQSYFKPFLHFLASNPLTKSLSWYLTGLAMVFAHGTGGHTTYFLGQLGNGWWYYFPVSFVLKTPIPILIFILLGLGVVFCDLFLRIYQFSKDRPMHLLSSPFKNYLQKNFHLIYLGIPILIFWITSMKSSLNLGLRYLLPTYPFLDILLAYLIYLTLKYILRLGGFLKYSGLAIVSFLGVWYIFSSLSIFPYYLGYFNEFIGGPKNAYKYSVDSNLDWGQGLKRLKIYMDKKGISHINLAYFGKADPDYYKINYHYFRPEDEGRIQGKTAISATALQASGVFREGRWIFLYDFLRKKTPEDAVGYSILIYDLP